MNCDRTFRAKVTEIVQTDKIRVLHNGKTYTVYSSIFCEVDDMVRVCVPCGNWQELYVIENRSKGKTLRDLYQKVGENSKNISTLQNKTDKIFSRSVRQHLVDCNRYNAITIDGDLNTYYPVAIELEEDRTANDWPVMFCLGKTLGSKTAAYPGNHSNGTSSCAYGWALRQSGWDGNCNWMKTLYARYNYAPLVSHMQYDMSSYPGFCLFLRGGGTEYRLMCSTTFSTRICYSETNLGSSSYPQIVKPRTDMGNKGILDDSITE